MQPVLHKNAPGRAHAAEQLRAAVLGDDLLGLLHRGIGARAAHAPAVFAVVVERDIVKVWFLSSYDRFRLSVFLMRFFLFPSL